MTQARQDPVASRWARTRATLHHEFAKLVPPTLFFFVGFNLILLTKRLLLAEYLIEFSGFAIATVSALIVGKTVLIADFLPFLRRFDQAPLIKPILYKTTIYWLLVAVVRLLEALLHYLLDDGSLGGGAFLREMLGKFSWSQFIATQMWIFVLFLLYVTASELNKLFGEGQLHRILFTRRPSELQLTRRARIRLLIRLERLTDAHTPEALRDPASAPHAELMAILRALSLKVPAT